MSAILHITTRAQWDAAQRAGGYRGDTLDSEGFIHCSRPHQVIGIANALFRGRTDIVLLCIEPGLVEPEIRHEGRPGGEQFPHIYGPLNLSAVTHTLTFLPRADGTFALPDTLTGEIGCLAEPGGITPLTEEHHACNADDQLGRRPRGGD